MKRMKKLMSVLLATALMQCHEQMFLQIMKFHTVLKNLMKM